MSDGPPAGRPPFDPGYHPSPRPTFEAPTAIPHAAAARHVWGDAQSGQVLDWIYVSSNRIHQLLFEIPVAGAFTHSDQHRTVFGADEVLYIVDGDVAFADPESGQVLRARSGDAVCFGPDTWHHCFNWGTGAARVLELFAPPPSTGTSSAHARTRPLLERSSYGDDAILGSGCLPGSRLEPGAGRRLALVRPDDLVWRLEGDHVLTGLIASTPHLTAACCDVRSGGWSGWRTHAGDAAGFVLEGTLVLRVSGGSGRAWHELTPGDGFYVPLGGGYQVRAGGGNARFLLGAAPSYGGG